MGLVLGAPPENLSPPRTVGRNDFLGTYDPVKGDWLYDNDPYGPNGFMSPRKGGGRDPGTGQRVHTAKAITPLSPCVRSSRNPGALCLPPPPLLLSAFSHRLTQHALASHAVGLLVVCVCSPHHSALLAHRSDERMDPGGTAATGGSRAGPAGGETGVAGRLQPDHQPVGGSTC